MAAPDRLQQPLLGAETDHSEDYGEEIEYEGDFTVGCSPCTSCLILVHSHLRSVTRFEPLW